MKNSSNKPSPNDNRSNVKNPNNPQYDKAHGNRGKQLNPNQKGGKKMNNETKTCYGCKGTGEQDGQKCRVCDGSGTVPK